MRVRTVTDWLSLYLTTVYIEWAMQRECKRKCGSVTFAADRLPFPISRRPFCRLAQMPPLIQMPFSNFCDICHFLFAVFRHLPLWLLPLWLFPLWMRAMPMLPNYLLRQMPFYDICHSWLGPIFHFSLVTSAIEELCLPWTIAALELLPSCDKCRPVTIASLWPLPLSDNCHPVTNASLWDHCHSVTIAALWQLPSRDKCRPVTIAALRQ